MERDVYDEFLDMFVERAKELTVGDGLEGNIDIGPMIDQSSLNSALQQIQDAVAQGARCLCGGGRKAGTGFFLEPTVLADVPGDSVCMDEETFAPVAPVVPFDEENEGVARANDTEYGLAAYAYTRDIGRAMRLGEVLEAGTVGINDAVPSTSICPFGGMKQSGVGRELGSEGLDAFLETKHVSMGSIS